MPRHVSIDALCELVTALLCSGYPSINRTARLLNVSTRTLQRQLNETGACYGELVDNCRCTVACRLLKDSQKQIYDIAAALGYKDASSFSRAFRRWTATAPRAYRHKHHSLRRDRTLE